MGATGARRTGATSPGPGWSSTGPLSCPPPWRLASRSGRGREARRPSRAARREAAGRERDGRRCRAPTRSLVRSLASTAPPSSPRRSRATWRAAESGATCPTGSSSAMSAAGEEGGPSRPSQTTRSSETAAPPCSPSSLRAASPPAAGGPSSSAPGATTSSSTRARGLRSRATSPRRSPCARTCCGTASSRGTACTRRTTTSAAPCSTRARQPTVGRCSPSASQRADTSSPRGAP
mmetsp:Transcript_6955/g.22785  ORF Transcript_6955/g.22785 Transcript_6955/m.22785 type:complete len:235 (+) Transcript_6955:235-939(+)